MLNEINRKGIDNKKKSSRNIVTDRFGDRGFRAKGEEINYNSIKV